MAGNLDPKMQAILDSMADEINSTGANLPSQYNPYFHYGTPSHRALPQFESSHHLDQGMSVQHQVLPLAQNLSGTYYEMPYGFAPLGQQKQLDLDEFGKLAFSLSLESTNCHNGPTTFTRFKTIESFPCER